MQSDYTENLPKCTSPEDVWNLMDGYVYPKSDNSLFGDESLVLRTDSIRFSSITPPEGLMGLAYRTLVYLKLDGEMGQAPINGGAYRVAALTNRVLRELNELKEIQTPSEITGKLLDDYIRIQKDKGISPRGIYTKIYRIKEWYEYAHMLPFFMRLNLTLFEESEAFEKLQAESLQEQKNYYDGIGGAKTPYPLDQLKIILSEAIDYIENHTADCLFAAQIHKETKTLQQDSGKNVGVRIATKLFRETSYHFSEPSLAEMQKYILSLKTSRWVSNPKDKGNGPIQTMNSAIHKLQASCVIVTLMLTAMRSGELDVFERYPKFRKSTHHELDESLSLERIVFKTAESDNGERLEMVIPPIVIKAIDILSQLSENLDGKDTGPLNFRSFVQRKTNQNDPKRINDLIWNFCNELGIDAPSSHQFRHAMAFIVSYLNDADGIELAMMMLGHKSTAMTKKYLGHYKTLAMKTLDAMFAENKLMQEALLEFQQEQSAEGFEKIVNELAEDHPMVGPIIKRYSQFSGSMTDEAKAFFIKSQRLLLERGMLAIVQHPTHFCVRDLTDSAQMSCQLGFNREDFAGAPVMPSQCDPKCGCRLYTQQNITVLKEQAKEMEQAYPEDIRERLSQNTYFTSTTIAGTYSSVISEYEETISKKEA